MPRFDTLVADVHPAAGYSQDFVGVAGKQTIANECRLLRDYLMARDADQVQHFSKEWRWGSAESAQEKAPGRKQS